jgi:uncharacterized cupin superfamily protein
MADGQRPGDGEASGSGRAAGAAADAGGGAGAGAGLASVVNLAEVPLEEHGHEPGFEALFGPVGRLIGTRLLGCRLCVVPPGKKAWPYHFHHANEELFVILAGEGTLRLPEGRRSVRAGDVIACPPGPAHAHQLINNSEAELRYLAVSTMIHPEVMEYPDSGKVASMAGSPPGGRRPRDLFFIARKRDAVGYWEEEA